MVDKSLIFLDKVAKIISRFEEENISWVSVLEAFGFENLLESEDRLLDSQHFRDNDYGECISNIFKEAYKENSGDTKVMINHILQNDLASQKDNVNEALISYSGLKDFLNQKTESNGIDDASTKKSIKVFISYSNIDKRAGAKVKEILDTFGIQSFLAHDDISASEEWKKRILLELSEADVFIPILSENFRNSDWCSQESGIACFRKILFIPLRLDRTKPYGFMEYRHGTEINSRLISQDIIIKPITDHFPNVNIIDNLIEKLRCRNFRECQDAMRHLEPYFDKLDAKQINEVANISINNMQIWRASSCRAIYLPEFMKINKEKINKDKLEKLSELLEKEL